MGNENNVINCLDNKSERIVLKEGDFKSIKNFEPANNQFAAFLNLWDKIDFENKSNFKTNWFFDKGTQKLYTFMMDVNNKIITGASVEYHENSIRTGILQKDERNNETNVHEFQGNDIQKEKIKSFIVNKINGSKEEFKLVSNNVLSEAKQAVAATGIQPGGNYKITGNGVEGGQNQIG